jgi:hypothetical protein
MSLFRILTFPFLLASSAFANPTHAVLDEKHRIFFEENCTKCHNADKQKGKVRLDDIPFTMDTIQQADLWQKVLDSINSGDMPPEDEKQPDAAAKTDFLDDLSFAMVAARARLSDSGGKSAMRRLNRREYQNTIRDLLGVEPNVSGLPADSAAGTFDTVGASLFMSSDQFEQYLTLGRSALDEYFLKAPTPPPPAPAQIILRLEPETEANAMIDGTINDWTQLEAKFKPWAAQVDRAAMSPENAQAMAEIMAKDPKVRMPPAENNFMLYFQSERIIGAPRPQDHGLGDPHNAAFVNQLRIDFFPLFRHFASLPHRQQGAYLMITKGYTRMDIKPPAPLPAGEYMLRLRLGATQESAPNRRFIEIGTPDPADGLNMELSKVWSTHQVTGGIENPQILEVPIQIKANEPQVISIRERQPRGHDARMSFFYERKAQNGYGPDPVVWVDWVELEKKPDAVAFPASKIVKERRELEYLANKNVSHLLNNYFKANFLKAKNYLDSDRSKPPSSFGLLDEAAAKFAEHNYNQNAPTLERYLNDPLTQTGAYLTVGGPHKEDLIALPPDKPSGWDQSPPPLVVPQPGKYMLRFRIGANPAVPKERRYVALGSRKAGVGDQTEFNLIETFQVTANFQEPQIIEFPVDVTLDGPRTFVLREKRIFKNDHLLYNESVKQTGVGPVPALWVDWVEWEGPFPSAPTELEHTVQLANTKNLDEASHAKECFNLLATRAFRGKTPGQEFLDKLFAIYQSHRTGGDGHEVALKDTLSIILASPGFLYLQETGLSPADATKPGEKIRLSAAELASRLSYFLWSSPPDATLSALASSGELMKPEVLTREVDRMIDSPKCDEFINGFIHQWLGMARLDFFEFNNMQFRDFDDSAKAAARREVYETFAHLLRGNGSLSRLLKSDEIHVNSLLATFYGIEGVNGDEFQKVKVPANSPRGGLLGMAAILAMGGNGERTSPVERGAWVLRHLLHNPPPPAPPNVPQLSRLEGKPLSSRERVAAHMEEPQCASCHRKIDPIGFGLENFDAVGKWRTIDRDPLTNHQWPIDPAGSFHNGPAFKDYFELRDLIASKNDDFAQGFTEGLIEYALGRPYGFTDSSLAAGVIARAKTKDLAVREFIQALVLSREFGLK